MATIFMRVAGAIGVKMAVVAGAVAGVGPGAGLGVEPAVRGGGSGQPAGRPEAVKLEDLPAGLRLGLRAGALRDQIPVIPVVVIVPDARSFVEAVGHWKPRARYPVFIEDGSLQGNEDIARFVRAFRPSGVVRWSFTPGAGEAWPKDAEQRETLVEGAMARAWDAAAETTPAGLIEHWQKIGIAPPGLVVANIEDPAWPAALTLATGHAQPLAWVKCKQGVSDVLSVGEGDALVGAIESAMGATGLPWQGLGNDLDSVALCMNCPTKILVAPGSGLAIGQGAARPGDGVATTDRVGRSGGGPGRWGWASQVFGSERQSAYRAMCGLFLTMESAWLFDGHPATGKPWTEWDCTPAAETLKKLGMAVTLDDSPRAGRADWRARASGTLDVDLVMVNSKGECGFFELNPGAGRPGDTPILGRPAAVVMVHSWSLQYANVRETVGGRWIDSGAYAYFGSVQEPYLGAFLPTPLAALRVGSGFAWAAAFRGESMPAWRLACIGDPLITRGPARTRLADALPPLEGAVPVKDLLAEQMKSAGAAGRGADVFGRPLRQLVVLGEDEKVGQIVEALAREKPDQFTLDVAVASMFSLARTGRVELLARAFEKLDERTARDGSLRDALWAGAMGALSSTQDQTLVKQLRRAIRPDQAERDAVDLAQAYARALGKPAAIEMLQGARALLKDAKKQAEVDAAIASLK